jgi:nicotinamide-nucleotide amidase
LYNENGTAPGYIMEKDGKHVILLPGPPNECIPMFEKDVYSYLSKLSPYVIYSKMVKLCGIGESLAETRIEDLIKTQTNPTIATYAKTGEVHIRVTACAENEDMARKLVKPTIKILKERFGDRIYTTKNKETLEASVVKLLSKNDLTITTAESCTGGLLSGRLINVPGASDVLKSAYITYSDKAKQRILRVKRSSLEKNTAVSEQVAAEMAAGAVRAAGADVAVSVTGLAGPDGGTDENPVGTVYIGCSVGDSTVVKKYCFLGNRDKIRESAVVAALTLVREEVMLFLERIKN